MRHMNAIPLFLAAMVLTSTSANAARGVLKANCILKVKGADLATSSVMVVPDGAPAFSLPAGTRKFTLDLPLNDIYLVSFEREGCPTKQVYFDARVPVELHTTEFTFPFQVTLEHLTADRLFHYDGPVGFVRYQHALRDFGYETQYVVKVNDELRERLEQLRTKGIDPKKFLAPAAAIAIDLPRGAIGVPGEPEITGVQAPNVREVPRLVHVVERSAAEVRVVRGSISEIAPRVVAVQHMPLQPIPRSVEVITLARADRTPSREERGISGLTTMGSRNDASSVRSESTVTSFGASGSRKRADEFLQEERRTIHVVRFIAPNGAVEELRKVAHAYGGVFYFDNSRSITEREFEELTAAP